MILYDGNELDRKEIGFELEPEFKIKGVEGLRFRVGEEGTITVGIKNVGNAVGEAKVKVKLLDLLDEEKVVWLKPEEVGTLNFRLQVPDDFEGGTHSLGARCEWSGASGERLATETLSLVRIVGIKLNVVAELDKEYYEEGEMATLTLTVTNLSDISLGTLNLSAKVKFNEYVATPTFTLLPTPYYLLLTFTNLPITHSNQKLNFGIYSKDERAIWLDAIYVREKGTLTIITDKQVYLQGETVTLTVILQEPGTVSLTVPGEPATATLVFNGAGSQTFAFKLPAQMLTGSYDAHYLLLPTSYFSLPIDVQGIGAVVKEARFDQEEYWVNEGFKTRIRLMVSEGFEGRLKAWMGSENNGTWTKIYDYPATFTQGQSIYEVIGTTSALGRQKLVYGIYLGSDTLVSSGSRQIDVYNIKGSEGKVITKGQFWIEIPAGGLEKSGYFDFGEVTRYSLPQEGIRPIKVIELTLEPYEIRILTPMTGIFSYDSLPEKTIEESLKAYYIVDGRWEEVGRQGLDMVNKRLTFYLPYLSLVGIGANVIKPLKDIVVYPNPVREKITFGDNLPSPIRVRIFNMVGEQVYEYEGATDNGKWDWHLENRDNKEVASGIYIYVISSSEGDKKVGKIGVVR
jgi:hypothetical protein